MGKTCKVVVCGQRATGKTALLEQLIYGSHVVGSHMFSTIEDIYVAYVDTDRNQKEKVQFYDTAGLDLSKPEIPKQYLSFADIAFLRVLFINGAMFLRGRLDLSGACSSMMSGYVLVYDVTSMDSFICMDKLKKEIDKNKEKKEAVIIALGNKSDLWAQKEVDFSKANLWAQKEKVRLWEVSVVNRRSLMDAFVWLTSRMTQPPSKSSFPLPMSRKAKALSVSEQ